MNPQNRSIQIKKWASELGFMQCGIAKAEQLEPEARQLEAWLKQGRHGQMQYMENYFEKRTDPRKLVPGAKSVISLLFNYYTEKKQEDATAPKISKYAYGRDYHKVVKKKLKQLFAKMQEELGEIDGRFFVDSAPVMDKAWAKRSGLGWIGKNTNLLNKQSGSFFFVAEIICDLELQYDGPVTDHCGTCTACIDACPTGALDQPYQIDGSKCISYFTIELKEEIPNEFKGQFENWAFGCDICQDVCPWNRFSKPHNEPDFEPKPELMEMSQKDWQHLNEATFEKLFTGSAVKRTGFEGLKRNVRFLERDE
ncbi:MAG: tRNA epoxyqueuosine(34) reductase QueG [Chitinophagales bacterium]